MLLLSPLRCWRTQPKGRAVVGELARNAHSAAAGAAKRSRPSAASNRKEYLTLDEFAAP